MTRQWKPGDVLTNNTVGIWFVLEDERICNTHGDHYPINMLANGRMVVVIDPEDVEMVDRLRREVMGPLATASPLSEWQAALRSLTEPPKPEEPTDPAARVTDRRENIWRLLADGEWVCTSGPDIGEYLVWSHLTERGPLSIEVTP